MSVGKDQNNVTIQPLENDLQTSETRYRRLFESARDGILILDAASRKITDVNPFMMKLLGYPREEFIGKELWEIGLLKDEETSNAAFKDMQKTGYIRYDGVPIKTKDGERREVEFISNVYEEGNRQVVQFNIRDNTEYKLIKRGLSRNEAVLADAQRIAHIGSWDYDIQNKQIVWSDEIYRIFDLPKGFLENTPELIRNYIHPEDVQLIKSTMDLAYSQGISFEIENRIIRPDGEERFVCSIGEVTLDESGNPMRICGTLQDITERKRIEQEKAQLITQIEHHRQRLDNIITNIPGVVWGTYNAPDSDAQYINFINDYARIMLGYSLEEWIAKPDFWISVVHPDDRARVLQTAVENFRKGQNYSQEYRWVAKDGRAVWIEANVLIIKDKDDQPIGLRGINLDITERRKAQEALRQAENNFRHLVESSPGIVYLNDPHPPYKNIYISPNVISTGYSQAELSAEPDMWGKLIHHEDRERVRREFRFAASQEIETNLEYRIISKDGRIFWWHDKGRFVLDDAGNKIGWQGIIVDITATKELEEQLRQSQKLESVGRLAGGIAHDFNNMLTAINGYSELTLRRLSKDDPLRGYIEEIKKAGERSSDLTRQLLAFSRQQVLQSLVIELNQVITDTTNMLERVIGEDIQLITALNPKVGLVKVDPGQFSQIITNLAVNARDAMPMGGKLTIETANVFLDQSYTRQHVGFLPGAYVMLAVSDTGTGMSDDIKQHIFEPFFTTKEVGRGTGLGLATVYGIVKQSGGNIEVYSEEGIGTTVKIYLPRIAEKIEQEKASDIPGETTDGTETILLVEDEESVRNLSREILEACGYKVIEARDGVEAMNICESGDFKFDLLITDVVMPNMGGRELAEKLKAKLPELLILFTSGYTTDAVVRHGIIEINTNFIQKPFSFESLARKVREMLDAKFSKD